MKGDRDNRGKRAMKAYVYDAGGYIPCGQLRLMDTDRGRWELWATAARYCSGSTGYRIELTDDARRSDELRELAYSV